MGSKQDLVRWLNFRENKNINLKLSIEISIFKKKVKVFNKKIKG